MSYFRLEKRHNTADLISIAEIVAMSGANANAMVGKEEARSQQSV